MLTQTDFSRHSLNEILCLSQSTDPNAKDAQKRIVEIFGDKLKRLTGRTCRRYCLRRQEQEDVLVETYQQLFNPKVARFTAHRRAYAQ